MNAGDLDEAPIVMSSSTSYSSGIKPQRYPGLGASAPARGFGKDFQHALIRIEMNSIGQKFSTNVLTYYVDT